MVNLQCSTFLFSTFWCFSLSFPGWSSIEFITLALYILDILCFKLLSIYQSRLVDFVFHIYLFVGLAVGRNRGGDDTWFRFA
ncbi:hypothetical protein EV426DRAFT_130431 [Tirmania nivea]|nr:hypothetical protein EV426DRAFT_130431 [Tirmania nivea]